MHATRPQHLTNPFADETVLSIGDLDIANSPDEIAISGSLSIRKDKASLARLKTLSASIAQIAAALDAISELPDETLAPIAKSVEMKNPFA